MVAVKFTFEERQGIREASFLGLPEPLLVPPYDRSGLPAVMALRLAPLTPWRENLLWAYGSPLVTGAPFASGLSLLQTLYLLSPGFIAGARCARLRLCLFCLRWSRLSPTRTEGALRTWYRAQFIDTPPRPHDKDAEGADELSECWFADFILTCQQNLHWNEAAVLHTPVARLLQYLAGLAERAPGEDRPRFNRRRDAQAGAYLRAKRARLAAKTPSPAVAGHVSSS